MNTHTATQIARFAGDIRRPLSHGERRELVALGLAYTTPGPHSADYVLTDAGRAILRDWRLAQAGR